LPLDGIVDQGIVIAACPDKLCYCKDVGDGHQQYKRSGRNKKLAPYF
jgi:hypothetical protein